MAEKIIITISRQYGSGGREIGVRLGELLGIPVYDHELITRAAEEGNLSIDAAHHANESATSSLLYTLAMGSNTHGAIHPHVFNMNINDKLYVLQSGLIKRLADEGSCIFIGRCADFVLRDCTHLLRIFIYADPGDRADRIASRHSVSRSEALSLMSKTDKRRASYYSFYTGRKWGKYENYDLALSSSAIGVDGTAELIESFARVYREKAK